MSAEEPVYVDPDVQRLLDAADPNAPDFWQLTPSEARRASDEMIDGMLPAVEVGSSRDLDIEHDSLTVKARLYLPEGVTSPSLLVFFHGGGWEIGSIEVADRPLRRLVVDSGCAILSVDYRLAPEDPFPAGFEDCLAATRWASANRAALGVRQDFLAVGGDSAGANLAAAVSQRFRDDANASIDHQLLIYPVVQRRFDTASYEAFHAGYFLTRATMQRFWELYLGAGEDAPPYADLLANGPLTGLPEATVLTSGLDPLRDEGELYANALAAAGVPVTLTRVSGVIHGIWYMDATGDRAYQFGLDVAGALRRATALPPSR